MTGFRSRFLRHNCQRDECYIQGLPSWDDICDAFPGKVRPTDVDGMVEINDHFLFIEEKKPTESWDDGQRIALKRLSRRERVTVLGIRPAVCSEVEVFVFRNGEAATDGWQPRSRQQLLDSLRDWAQAADPKRSTQTSGHTSPAAGETPETAARKGSQPAVSGTHLGT
ncbi:MAG TPA: hypothetical protein VIP77_03485 [Jiangellaceae bacterium]